MPARAGFRLALLLLAAGFGTASCGDGSGPEESVVGYYELVDVQHSVEPPPVGVQITGGSVTLMANGAGSWSQTTVAVVPNAIPHTESAAGTYSRSGNRVELMLPGRTMSMVFTNGNTLTYTHEVPGGAATTYVYRK